MIGIKKRYYSEQDWTSNQSMDFPKMIKYKRLHRLDRPGVLENMTVWLREETDPLTLINQWNYDFESKFTLVEIHEMMVTKLCQDRD